MLARLGLNRLAATIEGDGRLIIDDNDRALNLAHKRKMRDGCMCDCPAICHAPGKCDTRSEQ